MNIEITNPDKYNKVKKVANYGAELIDGNRIDGHLFIIYFEDDEYWTLTLFGVTKNTFLNEEFGFQFVKPKN